MPICLNCDKDRWKLSMGADGICLQCHEEILARKSKEAPTPAVQKPVVVENAALARIIVTTESASNLPIARRLDIITAEVVIGMHLFKDIAGMFRDVFGGRSKAMQDGLRDARKTALAELRREAHALGADAVVGVDLDYSEISGGGKNMLFLVASGTAVTLKPEP